MFQFDDFMKDPVIIPGEDIGQMQSNMRSQAPWMSFVPTAYYGDLDTYPDAARMIDSVFFFFFKDDSNRKCIVGTCGEQSIVDSFGEATHMESGQPAGRKLQVGFYYDLYFGNDHGDSPES